MAPNVDDRGNWIDPSGKSVPKEYIDPKDRKKDKVATQLITKALKLELALIAFKDEVRRRILDILDEIAQEHGEKSWKGNATITDFSNTIKITVQVKERIVFSEKLQLAKQKLDAFLLDKGESADPIFRELAFRAFQVDKKGAVNRNELLGLRSYKVNEPRWKEIIDLINEAIVVEATKQYITFEEKTCGDQTKAFRRVNLNFAAIE